MRTYNGHRSWNVWNVSLWIGNDEPLYRFALECIKEAKRIAAKLSDKHQSCSALAARAARYFMDAYTGSSTPDRAVYNHLSVKLCLQSFITDNA